MDLFSFTWQRLADEVAVSGSTVNLTIGSTGKYQLMISKDESVLASKQGDHLCAADLDDVRVSLRVAIQNMKDWP